MADLIIRGMEMPHDCPHCEFAAIGYVSPMVTECTLYCRAVDKFKDCATVVIKEKTYADLQKYDRRPSWCPLVPLPEGHGDLIDRDAFRAENGLNAKCEHCPTNTYDCQRDMIHTKMDFCGMLDDAPVIVPAEGGTDDGT